MSPAMLGGDPSGRDRRRQAFKPGFPAVMVADFSFFWESWYHRRVQGAQKDQDVVPLVYFDQSVWSMWAKGAYPDAVTQRLFELANRGRFVMVISSWHEIETVK